MEYEYYEDVIDAYEAGIGVEEGDSLTDYIRKNNIKIINIEPFRPTESKADGGSVGIEVLFGPKVPAAPSQLVSESDILLGYRGDAAYRSGSEQSKSIGQGNVGSKASFGGGKGVDSSGKSEGAGGINTRQYTTDQQNVNNIKAQLGIKDPNLLQKTFNKYNSLPFYIKGPLNTIVPTEYMKLFNIGNAINTGVNQMNNPDFTEEDLTLGATKEISFEGNSPFMRDQINERIIAAENEYYKQGKMPPEFLGDKIRMNMEIANQKGYMGPGFEDGGRVGFFMGGPALEGEALAIYNSMKAYGNDDQTIADKLQSLGMYTPGDSTPDTPDTTSGQTIGYQGGGGGGDNFSPYNPDPNRVKAFKEDVRVMPAMEALQRNQQLTSMGIEDPFANEASLDGAYYGDMFEDTSNQVGPAEVSGFQKFKNTLSSAKTNLLNNPVTNAIGFAMNPAFGAVKGILGGLKGIIGPNQRAITENIAGNMGIRVNDIGQIVNTGDYNTPEGVMAGYNLNKIDQGTFDKRYDRIEKTLADKYGFTEQEIEDVIAGTYTGPKGINKTTGKFTTLADLYRNIQTANKNILDITNLGIKETERIQKEKEAKEKLARLAAEEAALKAGQAPGGGTWQGGGGPAYTGPGGVGGGQFTDSLGNTDYQDAYDPGGGEKDGGIIGYRNGGLATMFTRRR
jgi:hypothetical protein